MTTIEEDYVSFEIAKLLKEKGFDCKCLLYYNEYGQLMPVKHLSNYLKCPTLQMAIKWLRETYNIHIVLSPNKKMNNQYCSIIFVDKEGELHPQPTDFFHGSYEEAADNAIKYSLENLI